MDQFLHIRIIIGIVLGLGITLILRGLAKFIQHPGRYKTYGVHLAWGLYVFMMLIHFWWWEFHLHQVEIWKFPKYTFIISYIVIYFMLSAILFPDDINDYNDYKDYFNSRRRWFFGLLAVSLLMDVGDSYLKGAEYVTRFGVEYFFRVSLLVGLSLLSIRIHSEKFQIGVVSIFIMYESLWMYRMYMTLG